MQLALTWLAPIALIAACVGFADGARRLARAGESALPFGARVVCGLALLIAIGGWFVLLSAYSWTVALGLLGLGCLGLVSGLQTFASAVRGVSLRPRLAWLWLPIAAGFVITRGLGAAHFPYWNPCDDLATYMHFPRLLLETGGFLEPFNFRRLAILGSGPFVQSYFWPGFGSAAIPISDAIVGQLATIGGALAVAEVLSRGSPGRARLGVGFVTAALFGSLTIQTANSSPTLLPFGGCLVLFALTADLARAAPSESRAHRAVFWGVVAAWLIGLRTSYALVPASLWLVELASAATRRDRARLERSALAALACGLALLPWSLTLWRSSGTPLFPLISGNYRFEGLFAAPLSIAEVGSHVAGCLFTSRAWAVLPLAVIAGLAGESRRVAWQIGGTALAAVVASALGMTAFDAFTVTRYCAPFVLAALLFLSGIVWLDLRSRRVFDWRAACALATGLVWLLVPARTQIDFAERRVSTLGIALTDAYQWSRAARQFAGSGFSIAEVPGGAAYAEAQRQLPPGARLVSAVEKPFFWDFGRDTIHTLDCIGQVSPGPGMPFFSGPEDVASYLRGQGYTHLAFTPAGVGDCLYSAAIWSFYEVEGPYLWRAWAPRFLDFFRNEQRLRASRRVAYASRELVVLDLRSARLLDREKAELVGARREIERR